MKNKKNSFLNKPLPHFFGVFVLFAALLIIFWLSRNVVLFDTKAALGNTPKNIQISNIAQDSFTVTFITDEAVNGTMSYGNNSALEQVAFDTRDKDGPSTHKVHHITAAGLDPGTKYFFSIASGDGIFQNDLNPYEVITAPNRENVDLNAKPIQKIKGSIIPNGEAKLDEALILIESEIAQTITTLIAPDGSFEINLDSLLAKDLSSLVELKPDSKFKLTATNGNQAATAVFLINQSDPLPPITLTQDYDFTSSFATTTTATNSAQTTPFPIPSDAINNIPAILTPKSDEEFKDQKPLFRGTAAPESDVEITIESSHRITATVQANKNGIWEYRPETPIEPGEHTITIAAFNNNGLLETLSRSFTVFATGSQFVEPSISPTPSETPTATIAPSPTVAIITPTISPTLPISTPTSTIAPTIEPTIAPTETIILPTTSITNPVSPTTQIVVPPVPDVGGSALIIGFFGTLITIIAGGILFLLL